MSLRIIETGDASHSLYNDALQEKYHSTDGAWTESMYVYIQKGLLESKAAIVGKPVKIFEMGFGTGLNAFQTYVVSSRNGIAVEYYTVEKFPLDASIYTRLNYTSFENETFSSVFQKLHTVTWGEWHTFSKLFLFKKESVDVLEIDLGISRYDVVYFDAFAPSKQPEVWDVQVFEKLFTAMKPGANLVTYCAQGAFKRKLKATGFVVERLPGPPGKREMTRAIKPFT